MPSASWMSAPPRSKVRPPSEQPQPRRTEHAPISIYPCPAGSRELRRTLEEGGVVALPIIIQQITKNLRRKPKSMMAVCECVAVLAACVEAHPAESAAALPRVIAAVTDQVCCTSDPPRRLS